ncbi:hypothetical protein CALVIDRAFT_319226 [Calocera viscosa TUFC12733]|uniref:Uncharacterized protein n=1 Tax=Calocera viscosa (strain TUFC12733) TaxID=1330018 RepID=A0A167HZ41_CALVF|nr:hypothetical protein CALVIDRAFT_319226 [Calocera viscosa TUFC12733]
MVNHRRMPDIEDEGRVAPVLIWGDEITFRMEDGTVHQICVDFTHTKTHPNFPPRASYKELKAQAIAEAKTARTASSSKTPLPVALSTGTFPGPVFERHGTISRKPGQHTADYRIHEDGTLSGKRLPPLPPGRVYKLAYVDIPPYHEACKCDRERAETQPLSPLSDRTKVDPKSPYMHFSKLSPVTRNPSRLSKYAQNRYFHNSKYYDHMDPASNSLPEKHQKGKQKKSSTASLVGQPRISRKRKRDEMIPPIYPQRLIIRIRRPKSAIVGVSRQNKSSDIESEDETEADEPVCCWSTSHMYPLTERYHTMYNYALDEDPPDSLRSFLGGNFNVFDNSSHSATTSEVVTSSIPQIFDGRLANEAEITKLAIKAALTATGQSIPLSLLPPILPMSPYIPLSPTALTLPHYFADPD